MEEVWRDVVGYEGFYLVSNYGRVRSVDRMVGYKKKGLRIERGVEMTIHYDQDGYPRISLCRHGGKRMFHVHRLVAIAFIPNPNNLPMINHKDENKTNNFVYVNPDGSVDESKSNLEWCDVTYNNRYGNRLQIMSNILKNRKDLSRPVSQYTKDGVFVASYASLKEIRRQHGYDPSFIGKACVGIYKSAYGCIWKFTD